MSYIEKNLLPGEVVQFQTRKTLFIFTFPVIWLIICVFASKYMLGTPILAKLVWLPWIACFILWASVYLGYITSEFVVTNKRIMMREGLFTRHANETRLSAISQVIIVQTLFGQLLGYGNVSINTYGVFDNFALLASPHAFQKMVNAELDKLVK